MNKLKKLILNMKTKKSKRHVNAGNTGKIEKGGCMIDKEWWVAFLKLFTVLALILGIICFLGVFFDTGSQIDDEWKPLFHFSPCSL